MLWRFGRDNGDKIFAKTQYLLLWHTVQRGLRRFVSRRRVPNNDASEAAVRPTDLNLGSRW